MRRLFPALFVVLVALSNCFLFPIDLCFEIDPTFTSDQQDLIHQAADNWNELTNKDHKITFAARASRRIYLRDPGVDDDGLSQGEDILLRPSLLNARLLTTATHEFGHSLGFPGHPHIPGPALMDESGSVPYITETDYEVCVRIGVC